MASEKDKQEYREILRRLEEEDRQAKAKALRLRAEIADLEAQNHARGEALIRAKLPFPEGDVCPECWITRHIRSPMKNVPSRPILPMQDRFVCGECGREDLRNA